MKGRKKMLEYVDESHNWQNQSKVRKILSQKCALNRPKNHSESHISQIRRELRPRQYIYIYCRRGGAQSKHISAQGDLK